MGVREDRAPEVNQTKVALVDVNPSVCLGRGGLERRAILEEGSFGGL